MNFSEKLGPQASHAVRMATRDPAYVKQLRDRFMTELKDSNEAEHKMAEAWFRSMRVGQPIHHEEAFDIETITAASDEFCLILLRVLYHRSAELDKRDGGRMSAGEIVATLLALAIESNLPFDSLYLNSLLNKVMKHTKLLQYFSATTRVRVGAAIRAVSIFDRKFAFWLGFF